MLGNASRRLAVHPLRRVQVELSMKKSSRRIFLIGLLACLAFVVLAPGQALAVFSAGPAVTAGVTAATISAPTGFTATAVSGTSVTLSWTAPSTLTGYTLSQSSGTLAGCSATPSATTTS